MLGYFDLTARCPVTSWLVLSNQSSFASSSMCEGEIGVDVLCFPFRASCFSGFSDSLRLTCFLAFCGKGGAGFFDFCANGAACFFVFSATLSLGSSGVTFGSDSLAPQFGQFFNCSSLLSKALLQLKQITRPKVAFALSASCFSSLLSARFCSNGISATMCSTKSPASRIFFASSSCPALSASSHFSKVMSSMSVKSLTLSKVPLVKSQQIQRSVPFSALGIRLCYLSVGCEGLLTLIRNNIGLVAELCSSSSLPYLGMPNSLVLALLVLAVKSVSQKNRASLEILWLLEEFRRMVNVCIAVGVEENVSSLKTLSLKSYHRLSSDMLGYYRLGAISKATVILHNHRKAKKKNPRTRTPYARKLVLTTCYGFKIKDGLLRLPVKPRQYTYVKLNRHSLQVLSGLSVRSVTLTPGWVSITYSKETVEIKPEGYVGVDRNLDNVTT